jgi:hypothetical protein
MEDNGKSRSSQRRSRTIGRLSRVSLLSRARVLAECDTCKELAWWCMTIIPAQEERQEN